jgi:uncharacterized protein (TIGR03118 family)
MTDAWTARRHTGRRGGARRGWWSRRRVAVVGLVSGVLVLGVLGAGGAPASAGSRAHRNAFVQVNLVSDLPSMNPQLVDPALINPWGMAFGRGSNATPLWVNNQGSLPGQPSEIQLYRGATPAQPTIEKLPLVVDASSPTGMVFNSDTSAFLIDQGQGPVSARFIFAELFDIESDAPSGQVSGWAPATPTPTVTSPGTARKTPSLPFGLALVPGGSHRAPRLLVADTLTGGIDVYDSEFEPVATPGRFVDRRAVRREMAPYNVAFVAGKVYVTYTGETGAAVSVFTPNGRFVKRLTSNGPDGRLVEPWGIAKAPHDWGRFGGDLLVGDTGTGMINAFDARTGRFQGVLRNAKGAPLVNLGLWEIKFGNGVAGTPRTLLFAAGIGDEVGSFEGFYEHGLLGLIKPAGRR